MNDANLFTVDKLRQLESLHGIFDDKESVLQSAIVVLRSSLSSSFLLLNPFSTRKFSSQYFHRLLSYNIISTAIHL